MKLRFYMILVGCLLVLGIVDVLFVHAHYHTWYHELHGFEIFFGLLGAFALMLLSLGLGEVFLWKTTCSILLTPEIAGFGNETAKLNRWFKDTGDTVRAGQPIAGFETSRGTTFTINAPYDGKVSKCFIETSGRARIGETVVDLQVSKHSIGHGEGEKHG